MKKTTIIYWVFTGLFTAFMAMSAIPDILSVPMAVKGMHEGLGYPLYFIPFIGVAKVLGVIAILVPGYPRIKEWAYAGLVFDLIGATYSIFASGQPVGGGVGMIVPLALAAGSYIFYHKKNGTALHIENQSKKNELKFNQNHQVKIADTTIA